jgi:alcohol dehydrogenase
MAIDALASGSPANNPRVPLADDLERLYRAAYFGGTEAAVAMAR